MEAIGCPHHEKVIGDVERHEEALSKLHDRLSAGLARADSALVEHAHNGGTGHVLRVEFDKLATQVDRIRTMLMWALVGMLVAASGGSALAPTIKAMLLKHLGVGG